MDIVNIIKAHLEKTVPEAYLRVMEEKVRIVLQGKPNNMWSSSPSGENHIIVLENECLLVNARGVYCLFDSLLFCEGECNLSDFRWMESDHLVVFKVNYIVRRDWDMCICHYKQGEFFTYLAPRPKKLPFLDNDDSLENFEMT